MPVSFRCPSCRHKFRIRRKYVGKKSTCPFCQRRIRIKWKRGRRSLVKASRGGIKHFVQPEGEQALENLTDWEPESAAIMPISQALPRSHRSATVLPIAFGIAIVVLLGSLLAWMLISPHAEHTHSGDTVDALEKPMVGVLDLLALYHASEEVGDSQYKDKWVFVTGTVDKIVTDGPDGAYLNFQSGKEFSQLVVQSRFDPANARDLANITEGQRIHVSGRCIGFEVMKKQSAGAVQAEVKDSRRKIVIERCTIPPELEGSGIRQ